MAAAFPGDAQLAAAAEGAVEGAAKIEGAVPRGGLKSKAAADRSGQRSAGLQAMAATFPGDAQWIGEATAEVIEVSDTEPDAQLQVLDNPAGGRTTDPDAQLQVFDIPVG